MKKHLLIGASLCALSLSAQAQRIDFDNAPLNPGATPRTNISDGQ